MPLVIQAGIGSELARIPMLHVMAKQLDVKGPYMTSPKKSVCNHPLSSSGTVRYSSRSFDDAVDLLARNLIDLSPLVTSTFPIERSAEAFQALKAQDDIKIVILSTEV